MSMYCFQCQETAKNVACTVNGVCGKKEDVANLQDLLLYAVKGVSIYRSVASLEVRNEHAECNQVDFFILESLFMTITNANFDRTKFVAQISAAIKLRDKIKATAIEFGVDIASIPLSDHDAATFTVTESEMDGKAALVGILATADEDVRSLRELLVIGLKGMAAYGEHAFNLKKYNKEIVMFIEKALLSTIDDAISVEDRISLVMECGKFGVDAMALLDGANTGAYGNPEITQVKIGTRNNPAILISGHDLKDLELLLEQTKGTGVDVYTHSEMLPAHAYPFFKKFDNLYGNYGNAWWKQNVEFESFNGPVLFTTNCITPPKESYKARVYTTGASGFPGCTHIDANKDGNKDFSAIIE
ncbi:hydroxylamine reductase, partial [bacterium]|nr:hydroxylamine reductase [bacterium]